MRILTWNINGIRACKQSLKQELSDLSGDIVCLQETKITRDLLDEETAIQDGYSSYFSFSKKKSGYSGVATYCKAHATPVSAEEGLSGILTDKMKGTSDVIGHYGDLSDFTNEELISLDSEGRAILTEHQYRDTYGNIRQLVVINVYCPRADPDREGRLNYKLQFYKLLQIRAEALLKAKKTVIILGDFNVSHKPIDHCNPDADDEKFYARPSRHWLGQLLMDTSSSSCKSATKQNSQKKLSKFIDTFRYFHPTQENAFTCWSTVTGARITNYGTRIDYIVSDVNLCQEEFEDCEIVQDFEGSDHCPVRATLKGTPEPFDKLPSMCTKFMPEFYGRQQKLSTFFTKGLEKEKSAKTERTQAIGSASLGKEKLPSSWKRNLGKSDYEPSFKRTKSDSKNKSHKTVSITNFFKKVPSATQGSSSKETQNLNDMQLQNDTDQIDDITKTYHISKVPRGDEEKGIDGGKTECSLGMTGETNSSETNELVKGTNVRSKTKKQMVSSWKDIFKGPRPPPLCKGHKEPCLLRTVKKPGPNLGKQFYVCCRPEGHKSNPEARCNNFEWVVSLKKLKEVKGDEHERETKI